MVWIGNNWPFGQENRFCAQKHLNIRLFWWTRIWVTWLWRDLDAKRLTQGQLLGWPWKVWGITLQTSYVGSVTKNQRCYKKLKLLYFWSDRFETNRTWSLSIGAIGPKIQKVLVFRNTEFASPQISKWGSTSEACITVKLGLKDPLVPLPPFATHSEPSKHEDSPRTI